MSSLPEGFEPLEHRAKILRAVLDVFVAAAEHATGKPLLDLDASTQHFALRYACGMVGLDLEVRKVALERLVAFGAADLTSVFEAFLAALFSILEPELSLEKADELSSSVLRALEAFSREAVSAQACQLEETVN